jgi:hypothetical protein
MRTGSRPLNIPISELKQNLRLHSGTQLNTSFPPKGRTQMVWFDKNGTDRQEGLPSYLEAGYQSSKRRKGKVRLQYFETRRYNSRLYTYESDVL